MGGYGSGRCEYSLTTKLDEGLKLNINKIKFEGKFVLNSLISGVLQWKKREIIKNSINYELNTMNPKDMWMRVFYIHKPYSACDAEELDYKIRLSSTQPNYGGKRLWFLCPLTGKRATTLYLPSGYKRFASRYGYNLKYTSQSKTPIDRKIDRMWKLKEELGENDYWCKPKGMHKRTFDLKLQKVCDAEEELDSYFRGKPLFRSS
ncbi:MAG: hypothetical protein GW748_01705 [Alphaproteobacteria bacterium]|nr:hypothetical protein [Alphaproteobacteria bacterium]NCQ66446.1 hypothetical protein [Alphaproteobacteria bacterium]